MQINPEDLLKRFLSLQPDQSESIRPYKQTRSNVDLNHTNHFLNNQLHDGTLKRSSSIADFVPVSSKRVRLSSKHKQVFKAALNAFELKLNAVYSNEASITVENTVDPECKFGY